MRPKPQLGTSYRKCNIYIKLELHFFLQNTLIKYINRQHSNHILCLFNSIKKPDCKFCLQERELEQENQVQRISSIPFLLCLLFSPQSIYRAYLDSMTFNGLILFYITQWKGKIIFYPFLKGIAKKKSQFFRYN